MLVALVDGNFVDASRVLLILDFKIQAAKHILKNAKASGNEIVNLSKSRKSLSVLLLDTGMCIQVPVGRTTLAKRFNDALNPSREEKDESNDISPDRDNFDAGESEE